MEGEKEKIVVDTNVLLSTLINPDSVVWNVLEEEQFQFIAPELIVSEIERYSEKVVKKLGGREEDYNYLLADLLRLVDIVETEEYQDSIQEAYRAVKDIDEKDTEFIALAITENSPLWTDDKDLQRQDKAEIKTSEEIIEKLFG